MDPSTIPSIFAEEKTERCGHTEKAAMEGGSRHGSLEARDQGFPEAASSRKGPPSAPPALRGLHVPLPASKTVKLCCCQELRLWQPQHESACRGPGSFLPLCYLLSPEDQCRRVGQGFLLFLSLSPTNPKYVILSF